MGNLGGGVYAGCEAILSHSWGFSGTREPFLLHGEFLAEIRARADEGYSTRQLMSSLIPDIGAELKVAASEVTAALQGHEVAFFWAAPGINYLLLTV